jgi:hypothetical protein
MLAKASYVVSALLLPYVNDLVEQPHKDWQKRDLAYTSAIIVLNPQL